MMTIDDWAKFEIKVGEILSVEPIEGSTKLLKLLVEVGEETPRQIVSGIAPYFEDPQELVGVKCPFILNLEPRKLMGIESQGMILAAHSDEIFTLLRASDETPGGAKVS